MEPKKLTKSVSVHFAMERSIEAIFSEKEEIYIKDFAKLKAKILAMKKDGKSKLNIFTDFDFTLTNKFQNGQKADNSFKAIERDGVVAKEFIEGCQKAREKYIPIEGNPLLSKEEKEGVMKEWWKYTQDLMVQTKMSKELVRLAVAKSKLYLRYGFFDMIRLLKDQGLQLHIVSGGIKAVVTETFYITQAELGLDLSKTIVYCMTPEIYNENMFIVGFEEPTIISTNKHLFMTHKTYPEVKEGNNCIVMGDLVEDYMIVKNLKMNNVIGIGFINNTEEVTKEVLDAYMDTYDIVIANDGNLIHIDQLIRYIIGEPLDSEYTKLGPSALRFSELLK